MEIRIPQVELPWTPHHSFHGSKTFWVGNILIDIRSATNKEKRNRCRHCGIDASDAVHGYNPEELTAPESYSIYA